MYHKKKLALFVSHIYGEYQSNLCRGAIHAASEFGYRLEVYTTNDGENLGAYSIGEESILDIPCFDEIDGVIFASDTYADAGLKNKIVDKLKKQTKCKVVEICENNPSFQQITLENNDIFEELADHLIKKHGATSVCYLGNKNESFFSDKRQAAVAKAMEKNGLKFDASNIFLTDLSADSLREALKQFTCDGSRRPDAVICYNDKTAIEFMMVAQTSGYNIPNDFALTGCDCSKAGDVLTSPLTSISFPIYELGECAVNALHALIQDKKDFEKTVYAKTIYKCSCGCKYESENSSFSYNHLLQNNINELESAMLVSMKMAADFSHVTDIDDGMDILESYIKSIKECKEFYLCLYSDWDRPTKYIRDLTSFDDYDVNADNDSIHLKLAIKNGKRLADYTFEKNSILPAVIDKDSNASYIISSLFFEDRAFGYLVMSSESDRFDQNFKFVNWVTNVTQLLENLRKTKNTAILTNHLEEIYIKDALTGLYNHHGFYGKQEEVIANASVNSLITAMVIDLDELKVINDQFGHSEGDFALKTIGHALLTSADQSTICGRLGGDEFYCLAALDDEKNAKDFLLSVDNYLLNFNKLSDKPYNISISHGYSFKNFSPAFSFESIDSLFEEADKKMYTSKKSKTKHTIK